MFGKKRFTLVVLEDIFLKIIFLVVQFLMTIQNTNAKLKYL